MATAAESLVEYCDGKKKGFLLSRQRRLSRKRSNSEPFVYEWLLVRPDDTDHENQLRPVATLSIAERFSCTHSVVMEGRIYGFTSNRSWWGRYSSSRKGFEWRECAVMNFPRRVDPVITCIAEKIYVFGGVDVCDPFGEVYDPKSNSWCILPEPPNKSDGLLVTCYAVVVQDDKAQVLMGFQHIRGLYGFEVGNTPRPWKCVDPGFTAPCYDVEQKPIPAPVIDNFLIFAQNYSIVAYDLVKKEWVPYRLWTYPPSLNDTIGFCTPILIDLGDNEVCVPFQDTSVVKCTKLYFKATDEGKLQCDCMGPEVQYNIPRDLYMFIPLYAQQTSKVNPNSSS